MRTLLVIGSCSFDTESASVGGVHYLAQTNAKGGWPMQERIQFTIHKGKQILFVDVSATSAAEVEQIARKVPDTVMAQPRG
jgi:hypothetical protein